MRSSSKIIKDQGLEELEVFELEVRTDFGQKEEPETPHDPERELLQQQTLAQCQALLEKAQQEAGEIIAQAQAEQEQIREAAREQGYQEGYEAGYQDGYRAGEAEAQKLVEEKAQLVAQVQEAHRRLYLEAEENMVRLALEIAEKVLHKQVELDPQGVLEVAKATLQEAHAGETYFLYVNPENLETAQKAKEDLAGQIPPGASLQIIADGEIAPGGCRVETELGITDGTLESQLAQLAQKLKAKAKEYTETQS